MNIWHDINPDRITPNDFMAVIEIEREARRNTSWTSRPV